MNEKKTDGIGRSILNDFDYLDAAQVEVELDDPRFIELASRLAVAFVEHPNFDPQDRSPADIAASLILEVKTIRDDATTLRIQGDLPSDAEQDEETTS